MIHTSTWMNLKNIILSHRSQTKKPQVAWLHLYEMSREDKLTKTENRSVAWVGLGIDYKSSVGNVWEWWKFYKTRCGTWQQFFICNTKSTTKKIGWIELHKNFLNLKIKTWKKLIPAWTVPEWRKLKRHNKYNTWS